MGIYLNGATDAVIKGDFNGTVNGVGLGIALSNGQLSIEFGQGGYFLFIDSAPVSVAIKHGVLVRLLEQKHNILAMYYPIVSQAEKIIAVIFCIGGLCFYLFTDVKKSEQS